MMMKNEKRYEAKINDYWLVNAFHSLDNSWRLVPILSGLKA